MVAAAIPWIRCGLQVSFSPSLRCPPSPPKHPNFACRTAYALQGTPPISPYPRRENLLRRHRYRHRTRQACIADLVERDRTYHPAKRPWRPRNQPRWSRAATIWWACARTIRFPGPAKLHRVHGQDQREKRCGDLPGTRRPGAVPVHPIRKHRCAPRVPVFRSAGFKTPWQITVHVKKQHAGRSRIHRRCRKQTNPTV